MTIVLIEHDMRVVFHLADRITVLDQGRLLAEGTPEGDRRQRSGAGRLSGARRHDGRARRPRASTPITARATSCTASASRSREGKITALLGRNGAGKTTTLRSLVGLTPPRERHGHDFRRRTRRAGRRIRVAALRRRLCAGRAADLRQSQRRGKPQGAARAAGAMDDRARLPAVSAACRAHGEPGPSAFRRRAGNAGDRAARCCSIRELLHARRAVAGPRAADRAARCSASSRRCATRAYRFCSSSRTPA